MSKGRFEDKKALFFKRLYIVFVELFFYKPRPREKEPSQFWPTRLGTFIARVKFPDESFRQSLVYFPNCTVAMRTKSELRQDREHGRKQPKSVKIHQMGFKAYHFVFECTIRSKSAEIPNVQKCLNCGGFRTCLMQSCLPTVQLPMVLLNDVFFQVPELLLPNAALDHPPRTNPRWSTTTVDKYTSIYTIHMNEIGSRHLQDSI